MTDKPSPKAPSPLKISMVGYLNTVPMVYGLEQASTAYNLKLEIPADCYKSYVSDAVDVALVPVGVLPLIEEAKVITDYCIGCQSDVRTVCLFSHHPIDQVRKIYLDEDSRTSVLLTRVLLANHWAQEVQYVSRDVRSMNTADLLENEAVLMIGDKVFEVEGDYAYKYDLGREWSKFTGLPFAFAVWIAKPKVSDERLVQLNKDLAFGIAHTADSLLEHRAENKAFDLDEYFEKHIDYSFDLKKKEALHIFLQLISDLPNPSF